MRLLHERARRIAGEKNSGRAVLNEGVGQNFLALFLREILEAAHVDDGKIDRAFVRKSLGVGQRAGGEHLNESEIAQARANILAMTSIGIENDNACSREESHRSQLLTGFVKKNHAASAAVKFCAAKYGS
jgi:hypothetical protein